RLQEKYPQSSHNAEIDEFREQLKDRKALRRAEQLAKRAPIEGEGQWFYVEGLRLRQRGDETAARQMVSNPVQAFADVKAEQPWVVLARHELEKKDGAPLLDDNRWKPARAALAQARAFRDQKEPAKAQAIWTSLEALYKDDRSATPIMDEIKRDRGR